MTTWVILGCGFVGQVLARRLLAEGDAVIATARREDRAAELRAAGIPARVGDPLRPATLEGWLPRGAVLVDSVPPMAKLGPGDSPHGPTVVDAAVRAGALRLVYLSSTGVYPRGDGSPVDEDTPVAPWTERGDLRLRDEQAIADAARAAGLPHVSLRIAGIYGPGRGIHARLRRGDYRVAGEGRNILSRIHVDDLVEVIVRAATTDPLARDCYVVADDAPCSARDHADGIAALLGLPRPGSVPIEELPRRSAELLLVDRSIRNTRIKKELGVVLRHPTWREGVLASVAAENTLDAGRAPD